MLLVAVGVAGCSLLLLLVSNFSQFAIIEFLR